MVIDSHCHAWAYWSYEPKVPDPESRGAVEQLIFQLDLHGVQQACIVSAQIDRNPHNNDYVAAAVRRYPGRLHQFADVDSKWSDTYHAPGAARRLEAAVERWPIKGFTHYLAPEDDGAWLTSAEGLAFFEVAAKHKLMASIACEPHHQPALRTVAERFPTMPVLCHHMAGLRAAGPSVQQALDAVLASADLPNLHLKLSGFHYVGERGWDYPNFDAHWIYRRCFQSYGTRMCWGSDFPVSASLQHVTYKQSLEAFRTHCTFVPPAAKEQILGGTLAGLLRAAREVWL